MPGTEWTRRIWAIVALGMLGLPFVAGDGYYLNTLNFIALYAMPAIGLCLLVGYCGQLSISHAAFFAIGAYTSGVLSVKFAVPPWLSVLVAQGVAGLIAGFIGWVVLRLSGHYLAIATLSFTVIVEVAIKEMPKWTGGLTGLTAIPPLTLGTLRLSSDYAFYFLAWSVALAMLLFALNIGESRIGRAFRAVREGEKVTELLGIDVSALKIQAFVLSSLFASIGGSLYAHFVGFVSPTVGSVGFAIDIILVLAFGGFDRLWGAMIGVAAVTYLNEYAVAFADYKRVVFGLVLIAIMMFLPTGLLPGGAAILKRLVARLG